MAQDQNNIATWPLHEQAKRLWEVEGGHCVSSLVQTLGQSAAAIEHSEASEDAQSLANQAMELCFPVDDWESAAREVGYYVDAENVDLIVNDDLGLEWLQPHAWQKACEQDDLEPHQREVFEHWIVSDWLADQLAARGEKVDKDFAGLTIWARTTTGQAVYADHVIEKIAAETYGREG